MRRDIFSSRFVVAPYWWEDFSPPADVPDELPRHIEVLVVGAGYAGIGCALTLAEAGVSVLVLDAGDLGSGASTRSGGQVSGGVNIAKSLADPGGVPSDRVVALLRDAAAAMTHVEQLTRRHGIDCDWKTTGRITGCWTPAHFADWQRRIDDLNRHAFSDAEMIGPGDMSSELGGKFYHGGLLVRRAGHLHPAKLYAGLLSAARRAGATVHGQTMVSGLTRQTGGFVAETVRGQLACEAVVIATNGYPRGAAARPGSAVVPVTAHMIATEELPAGVASGLIPNDRAIVDSRRVVNHFRLSPDRKRLVFGGRGRFVPTSPRKTAAILHGQMVRRFPQLASARLTHFWSGKVAMTADHLPRIGRWQGLHYAMGCNGSGVTMMPFLGHCVARTILNKGAAPVCAYDRGDTPARHLARHAWAVPVVGTWYQMRDAIDRWWAGAPELAG